MTTSEIIASVKTLQNVVESARQQTEKAGKDPSWLLVARGAFAKAIEQLTLHAQKNESQTEANKGNEVKPAPNAPEQVTRSLPSVNAPPQMDAEIAALRASK